MLPIVYSDRFLYGDRNSSLPECPRRLMAIAEALKLASWGDCLQWHEPKVREEEAISRYLRHAHSQRYIDRAVEDG